MVFKISRHNSVRRVLVAPIAHTRARTPDNNKKIVGVSTNKLAEYSEQRRPSDLSSKLRTLGTSVLDMHLRYIIGSQIT